jgi:predicted benzoate:H+ symporter BenE
MDVIQSVKTNLLGVPKAFTWSGLLSGMLVVFISVTGPIAILYQAAAAGNLTSETLNSWLFTSF